MNHSPSSPYPDDAEMTRAYQCYLREHPAEWWADLMAEEPPPVVQTPGPLQVEPEEE